MTRTGNVSSTFPEGFKAGPNFLPNVLNRAVWEDVLVFHSAMEYQFVPIIAIEGRPFHTWANVLNWIENIDTAFNQRGDKIPGSTIRMEKHFFPMFMYDVAPIR